MPGAFSSAQIGAYFCCSFAKGQAACSLLSRVGEDSFPAGLLFSRPAGVASATILPLNLSASRSPALTRGPFQSSLCSRRKFNSLGPATSAKGPAVRFSPIEAVPAIVSAFEAYSLSLGFPG